ncbi:MAG: trypsin-like peptidase domain-containing protein [Chloroflexota bacterium]|nr:trypsin-like peptidase domain-containing protein [Chloroflexota bacterium]
MMGWNWKRQFARLVLILTLLATTGCTILDGDDPAAVSPPADTRAGAQAVATPGRDVTTPGEAIILSGRPSAGLSPATREREPAAAQTQAPTATPVRDAGTGSDLVGAIQRVTDQVRPAVVFIATESAGSEEFLQDVPRRGVGSGVIYDPRGYILTNNHVVAGAEMITVVLPDGRRFKGRVVGRDPRTDLAVLKINGQRLPTAPLGESSKLEVGEWVVAIGNALGLPGGPTVTAGVVGALDRAIEEPNGVSLTDLIQTDAAINPGNSGGPLVNLRGEVVGINTAGAVSPSGAQAPGIGFAIGIDRAKAIAEQLVEQGRIIRPYLGLLPVTVTPAIAARAGLPVERGVAVAQVEPGTPAARAGLSERDVIVSVGGKNVRTEQELRQAIEARRPGDSIELTVVHPNGRRERVTVELAESPPPGP